MRQSRRRVRPVLPLLLAALVFAAPGRAEDSPRSKLNEVEKALGEARARQTASAQLAEALAAELTTLRAGAVTAAQAAQAHEAALDDLDARLTKLNAEDHVKSDALDRARARQGQLVVALERLARGPPEGLLLTPGTPIDALRGALLMARAVPPIEAQAKSLKADIDTLAAVRVEIDATEAQQRKERDALKGDQARIAALIERKAALQQAAQRTADESRKRQQQLAAEAGNLRDLVARADPGAAAPPPPRPADKVAMAPPPAPTDPGKPGRPARPFAQARGALVVPVVGALIGRYGGTDPQGGMSRGLTFATRPGAQVVAPYDGRVVFAGPFRGYGQILIIGHGDGYHSLLAGLDRIESSVGQWLMAGEPVGTMAGGVDKPRLYLELRHNNQPINPLPWLTTRVEKVNG